MKLNFHFASVAVAALLFVACTDSGPAGLGGSQIGTSSGGQISLPIGTSQDGQSSFSIGGASSSSGATGGLMGCYVQVAEMGLSFCEVGGSEEECLPFTEDGVSIAYQTCPSGWKSTCEGENDQGVVLTIYDYSEGGMSCEGM